MVADDIRQIDANGGRGRRPVRDDRPSVITFSLLFFVTSSITRHTHIPTVGLVPGLVQTATTISITGICRHAGHQPRMSHVENERESQPSFPAQNSPVAHRNIMSII